jgi:hypothetical protein
MTITREEAEQGIRSCWPLWFGHYCADDPRHTAGSCHMTASQDLVALAYFIGDAMARSQTSFGFTFVVTTLALLVVLIILRDAIGSNSRGSFTIINVDSLNKPWLTCRWQKSHPGRKHWASEMFPGILGVMIRWGRVAEG